MLVLVDGEQGQAIGVLVVALAHAVAEKQERAAHEHLQDQNLHRRLLGPRASAVWMTTVSELTGMTMAHTTGDIRPAYASATVTALYASATARLRRTTP